MNHIKIFYILGILLLLSCTSNKGIKPGENDTATVQEALINAKDGDIIRFAAGTFKFSKSLSLDGIRNVTLKGAGDNKTIFDFSGQKVGAEGVLVTGADGFTIEDLAIIDAKGDGIKVKDTDGITFRRLRVEWTKDGDSTNGSYGIYPVSSKNILMEYCTARGAADAGIYVGQSEKAVVRNNLVERNVAGIEVENTIDAEVYQNLVQNNTAGILIFDLPDLPKKNGRKVKVYENRVLNNNHFNFSPMGISVSMVPAGVGMLFMACQDVEVYKNNVEGNQSVGAGLFSLDAMGRETKDSLFDKYPSEVRIYDNVFVPSKNIPDTTRAFGKMLFAQFGTNIPVIFYDGTFNPRFLTAEGKPLPGKEICIYNNRGVTYFNAKTHSTNAEEMSCAKSR